MTENLKQRKSDSEEQVFHYQVEQIYLEVSRAITNAAFFKLYKKKGEPDDLNKEANISFSGAAISIAFAYAALEAFCNGQLHSKYATISPEMKKAGWKWGFKNPEYKQYFENEMSFEELIEKKDLREKLKVLASVCGIPPLHEKQSKLWNQLCQIVEDMRHFIIHPKPYPDTFQETMNSIMEKHKLNQYFTIAEKVIRYFYTETNTAIPDWLNENALFRFLNSNDLAGRTSSQKNNPKRIFWSKVYLLAGIVILDLILFVKKIVLLSIIVKYLPEILWCLSWSAFGISLGLWNSRTAQGEVLDKNEHYYTYFLFVGFIASLAAFVALGAFQDNRIRSYVAAALTGLIVGFVGDSLPEKLFGLTKQV